MDQELGIINPKESKIENVAVLERTIHFDESGFLVETMRKDDREVDGQNFAMSYTSETPAGVARDEDQWHHHKYQTDRFICVKGRIALALFDNRKDSQTFGKLEVLDLEGALGEDVEDVKKSGQKKDKVTYIVTVPEGVYHCYKNISEENCLLNNYPTQLYNPDDEGRTQFGEILVDSLGKKPFSWNLLED